jgi:hypothetical protein
LPPQARWTVEEVYDRNRRVFDVKRNGRAVAYDLDDLDEATRRVKKHRQFDEGDTVTLVDQDGHRHRLKV